MAWDANEVLGECRNLDEALMCTVAALREVADSGLEVHYVAGAISADGDEFIDRNLQSLLEHREQVSETLGHKVLVLTSPLIFTPDIYTILKVYEMEREIREQRLRDFWDGVIGSRVIRGVHFTPGWERSPGARAEHEAATRNNISIFYIESKLIDV